MTWNYRIVVHYSNGEQWFAIHEVYYNENGDVVDWLSEPAMTVSDEPDGIKIILEQMLKAFDKPLLKESDFDLKAVYKE